MSLDLFSPLKLGALVLPNRILMAPLTRTRAGTTHIPNELMVEYYRQRAGAGLIFTECTLISPDASAYLGEGGLFDAATQAGWKRVTEAVHTAGGRIAIQLWHAGRAAHSDINGVPPISSSNKPIRTDLTHTPKGKVPYETPRPLRSEEIPGIVELFRKAAESAAAAGFDAVQIHGAHGYLIDQFLRDSVNDRGDRYGGSIENRARLLLEIVDACSAVLGADRVGVRISPLVAFNDMAESQPQALVEYLAKELQKRGAGHLELRHEQWDLPAEQELARIARAHYQGPLLLNGGFDADSGSAAIREGRADAIVYGKAFLANPDLVQRYAQRAPLNAVDFSTLYTPGPEGYTDYPALVQRV
ncbi:MAG: alkene reductase [Nevskiaceae bacterium]|nr:MAG: alkene reductase [Nevskiaceae bacterium]